MLYAPLSSLEVTMAIILAALTRSFLIAIISIIVFSLIVEICGEASCFEPIALADMSGAAGLWLSGHCIMLNLWASWLSSLLIENPFSFGL